MIAVDGRVITGFSSGWSESWRWRRKLGVLRYVFRDRCHVMMKLLVGIFFGGRVSDLWGRPKCSSNNTSELRSASGRKIWE